MYIRQSKTKNLAAGETYFNRRLVCSERIAGKVRQVVVLPLGRHFPYKQEDWPLLCQRIEQIIGNQQTLSQSPCPESIERAAQQYAAAILARAPTIESPTTSPDAAHAPPAADFAEVDVNSLTLIQPRTVAVEHLGLHAMSQLGFVEKLTELGINGPLRAAIVGNIIGRMAKPGSEMATLNWLRNVSALGELIDFDFNTMPHMSLYRASDALMKHRAALEEHIFTGVTSLFGLQQTVTLYDLTNTYMEGDAQTNPKAKHGRSKENRSDCKLVTLGLVLDGSGFVRHSKVFDGSVAECTTLEQMLSQLAASSGALVIMDAGIATEANIAWLAAHDFRYLVVKRGGSRQFDGDHAVSIETAAGESVRIQKILSQDSKEVQLYCHSSGRERKENAMTARLDERFEKALQQIKDGLSSPRGEKGYDKLLECIGRIKEKNKGAGQHYSINLLAENPTGDTGQGTLEAKTDAQNKSKSKPRKNAVIKAVDLTWTKIPVDGSMATHPGVYCLRSNETSWDEEKLWRTACTAQANAKSHILHQPRR